MKNRLYALMMTAMMLFVPFLGVAASNPSELPDDTVIRFPDPNFEVMVRETIGKPTGDITATDVAGIAKLNVSGLYINDLTGIEYFTALTELDCRITELTALDMSQNPLLKALYCDESDLTTLNVSQNPALEVLTCSHIYQLAALDVSQNPALIKLFCSDNQLTTLDVSQNPALEVLDCDNNLLTVLDVSQNPALEVLSCVKNQLTALDVSHNTALRRLDCYYNPFPDKSAIIGLDENRLDGFVFKPYPQGD